MSLSTYRILIGGLGALFTLLFCAMILVVWVFYERSTLGIRHGWIVIPLSIVPGVATAFAAYLLLRSEQLRN